MPWTAADAKRFKKGLTSAQASQWAKIANGVLRSCQKSGGKDCEGRAIRVANSKFNDEGFDLEAFLQKELKMEKQVPKGALRFVDEGHGCHAYVDFVEGEEKAPKLSMVGYSGKVIKGHWYWGDLAIDLQGMQFEGSKFPILENHDTDRKIGFMGKPVIDDQGRLVAPDNAKLLETEAAQEFVKLSRDGFPYQSSISAKPIAVERLEQGASAEVNGFTMKGPGTIWRQSKFREMSCCVFGWDNKTTASAFSKEPVDIQFDEKVINAESLSDNNKPILNRREVKKIMNLEELKEQHPEASIASKTCS